VVKVVEFASMSIEANRQGLTATEESFLVCVDRWVCRQEARYLRERLLDSKLKLNNEAVASLIELREKADRNFPENVRRGREVLGNFFSSEPVRGFVKSIRGVPLYYGSLEYGDPKNLDADVIIACKRNPGPISNMIFDHMVCDGLIEAWKKAGLYRWRQIGNEPHSSLISTSYITNLNQQMIELPEDLDHYMGTLPVILTGHLINSDQKKQLKGLQKDVYDLADKYPLVTVAMNYSMEECLKIRRQRSRRIVL